MTQEPASTGPQTPVGDLSYEAARDQLVEVVRQLESGGVALAESMALWQRGEQLAQTCQNWLDGARATIDEARQAGRQTPDAGAGDAE